MKRTIWLVLVAVISASIASTDKGDAETATSDIDTASIIRVCSEYIGKDVGGNEFAARRTVERINDADQRARIGVPGHAPDRLVKLTLEDFPLDFAWNKDGNLVDWYRDWEIYIDDENMKLVKIVSTVEGWEDSVERSLGEIARLDSTMLNKSVDFAGYPDAVGTSLLHILRNCPFSPQLASYFSARHQYQEERMGDAAGPIWVVCLMDIPPLKFTGPGADSIPISARDFVQVIFDDETGKPIRGGN